MALRVLPRCKYGETSCDRQEDCPEGFKGGDIWMDALRYAADNGADVVNASLGSPQEFFPVRKSPYAIDTLEYMRSRGVLLVHSAGNEAYDNDTTSTVRWNDDKDNVIEVAASDRADNLASFSSYGRQSVDVSAPGIGILSTVPGGGYGWSDGTSMAAPHVAGAAAFLLSKAPQLSPLEVKDLLIETSDYVPKLASRSVSRGRINLGSAVASLVPDWLLVKPQNFLLDPGEELSVSFTISTQGLPAGDYQSDVLLRFSGD